MRGPGSLNNSGKLFMEHALFIHRLRARSLAPTEEKHMQGETEGMTYNATEKEGGKKTEVDTTAENTALPTVQ